MLTDFFLINSGLLIFRMLVLESNQQSRILEWIILNLNIIYTYSTIYLTLLMDIFLFRSVNFSTIFFNFKNCPKMLIRPLPQGLRHVGQAKFLVRQNFSSYGEEGWGRCFLFIGEKFCRAQNFPGRAKFSSSRAMPCLSARALRTWR